MTAVALLSIIIRSHGWIYLWMDMVILYGWQPLLSHFVQNYKAEEHWCQRTYDKVVMSRSVNSPFTRRGFCWWIFLIYSPKNSSPLKNLLSVEAHHFMNQSGGKINFTAPKPSTIFSKKLYQSTWSMNSHPTVCGSVTIEGTQFVAPNIPSKRSKILLSPMLVSLYKP